MRTPAELRQTRPADMTDSEYVAHLEQCYRRVPDPARFTLLEFTGMSADEYAEWIMNGLIPERLMRVAGRRGPRTPRPEQPASHPEPPERKHAMSSPADARPYYEGRSTDARFSRWVKVNVPDQRIFDAGSDPVTMTGGELYQLMFEAVERAYFWGADDVARPGWDADEIFGKRHERSAR